jgi:hypothetical protein
VVTLSDGQQSSHHSASAFTFIAAPIIQSITVPAGKRASEPVTIRGADFAGATSVTFNGRASSGFQVEDDGATIVATRPSGPVGSTAIVVTTPGGPSAAYAVWLQPDWTRTAIFVMQIVYAAVLIAALLAYLNSSAFRQFLPNPLTVVPLGVIWAGALGAVTLSMTGLVDQHRDDWDRSYVFWHLTRPIIGAIIGSFSYLVIAAGVLASGGSPGPSAGTTSKVSDLFYYALAFLVGYREATFRKLLERFADVILGPGETSTSSSGTAATSTPEPATGTNAPSRPSPPAE